jgi:malate dehydrogenase
MKIGIIGAGNVGASIAHIALMKGLGDIYLLDIAADMAKGKAMDLNQSKFLFNSPAVVDGGLGTPAPVATAETEAGSLGTACFRCPCPITRKTNHFR